MNSSVDAAIAPQVDRRVFRAVFDQLVGPHIAVKHLARDEIEKALGLPHGDDLVAHQLFCQGLQVGCEDQVRQLGLQVLLGGGLGVGIDDALVVEAQGIAVDQALHIPAGGCEGLVFAQVFLKKGGTLGRALPRGGGAWAEHPR